MGWNNPPIPWSEFERTLSDRRRPRQMPAGVDGGDSPAWSLKRGPYVAPQGIVRDPDALAYAELHAHSSYSFLDGASSPRRTAGGGGAPRTARPRDHRPRRLLRHRPLRGGGRDGLGEDGLRRGAVARSERPAERRTRSGGQPPARARPAGGGLPPARTRHHRCAVARRREGPAGVRPRRARRAERRALGGADRVQERCRQTRSRYVAERLLDRQERRRARPARAAVRPRQRLRRADRPRRARSTASTTTCWQHSRPSAGSR